MTGLLKKERMRPRFDNPDPVVVHLQFAVEFEWFAGEEQDVAGVVDNDGVRLL